MTSEAPKLSTAQAADKQDAIGRRPNWFNIETVTGKVSKVELQSRAVGQNGNSINEYVITIPEPRNVVANSPVDGAVELAVITPFTTGNNLAQQPYHWLVAAAQVSDPSIDDINGLAGKEWTFYVDTRQRFAGEKREPTMFYNCKPVAGSSAGSNGNTPAWTEEDVARAVKLVEGMAQTTAPDALTEAFGDKGGAMMAHLIITGKVKPVEGLYQLV